GCFPFRIKVQYDVFACTMRYVNPTCCCCSILLLIQHKQTNETGFSLKKKVVSRCARLCFPLISCLSFHSTQSISIPQIIINNPVIQVGNACSPSPPVILSTCK